MVQSPLAKIVNVKGKKSNLITKVDHFYFCLLFLAGMFDPYIPPEGDARLSTLSKDGLKQRTEQLRQTAASHLA